MSSDTVDSRLADVLLHPVFVLGTLLIAAFAYSVLVARQVFAFLSGLMFVGSVVVTVFLIWLFYRLVVAVEDLSETARRVEASLDDE